jgi:hypothetical protein
VDASATTSWDAELLPDSLAELSTALSTKLLLSESSMVFLKTTEDIIATEGSNESEEPTTADGGNCEDCSMASETVHSADIGRLLLVS